MSDDFDLWVENITYDETKGHTNLRNTPRNPPSRAWWVDGPGLRTIYGAYVKS
jgi:hypothetical protein